MNGTIEFYLLWAPIYSSILTNTLKTSMVSLLYAGIRCTESK